jgi:hypothetical protein
VRAPDGRVFSGTFNYTTHQFRDENGRPDQTEVSLFSLLSTSRALEHTIANRLWSGRKALALDGRPRPNREIVELINPADLDSLGVRMKQTDRLESDGIAREVTFVREAWFNPAKNNVVTRTLRRYPALDFRRNQDELDLTECTDLAQLPTGRWYATRIQTTHQLVASGSDEVIETHHTQSDLNFHATTAIPDEWFADPIQRFPNPGAALP